MYEKIGITLADSGKYSVHIIGYESKKAINYPNIIFYPLFRFRRISIKRIVAPWKFYKKLLQLKPEVVIIETPELLIVTILYKILFGVKMYYDVLENYYYNILYISKYNRILKLLLASCVRLVEFSASPFITMYLLAEKTYENELPFLNKKFAVLENRYQPIYNFLGKPKIRSIFHLLYTGTIAPEFGIYAAISLVKLLYVEDKRFHLTIIGYCADPVELLKVKEQISSLSFINLIGGDYPVSHSLIIEAIQTADIGLILYQPNRATENKIPTKLYEYLYNKLPFLLAFNPIWVEFSRSFNAAIVIDLDSLEPKTVICHLMVFDSYCFDLIDFSSLVWDRSRLLALF
jgi:glycosyltransferase involved in cell wall biosynthesis